MTFLEQQHQGAQFLGLLTQKAWESSEFKNLLINDPKAAIEQATGRELPFLDDKKIVVTDQTDTSTIYINIPAQPSFDELELTEEQLELVAGGATPLAYAAGVAVGVGVCWLAAKLLF
ncbi:NHLP leader peptide family RiPP precursor [Haliscomenobacter hydrossis]|uniref:TOMM propeptide domain protein n=1 Tax=Haliscomenobacter hydrossis (strain ATCC 27775 / DSM 1100 / LMG 10767 / O) TaxID=760192 RepID=F4L1P2_HALH1|nr:NHLP leader peptide family RiPP precursor [Haliscomenobacter hydrossis]AEE48586.1 TOMM propeptide domain protein [Haliscomenobacter hydrossis DSM 1100]